MVSSQIPSIKKWNELKKGKYANITPHPQMIDGMWMSVESEELKPLTKKTLEIPSYHCYLDKSYLFYWVFTYTINPLKRYGFSNTAVINLLQEVIKQLE